MSDQERRELLIEANRLFGLKGEPEEWRQSRRKKLPFGVYWRTLKTLRAMCDPVERVPPHGAWLWRLRNTADD